MLRKRNPQKNRFELEEDARESNENIINFSAFMLWNCTATISIGAWAVKGTNSFQIYRVPTRNLDAWLWKIVTDRIYLCYIEQFSLQRTGSSIVLGCWGIDCFYLMERCKESIIESDTEKLSVVSSCLFWHQRRHNAFMLREETSTRRSQDSSSWSKGISELWRSLGRAWSCWWL